MSRELDFLVAPFGGPVYAGNQARAVDAFEVAVAEAVPRFRLLPGPFRKAEVPLGVFVPRGDSRNAFSDAARGCTSPQSLSRTYWMSRRALVTAPSLSEWVATATILHPESAKTSLDGAAKGTLPDELVPSRIPFAFGRRRAACH